MYTTKILKSENDFKILQKLNPKFTSTHQNSFLSTNKWAYCILAFDKKSNSPIGYSISCLAYSFRKGCQLLIDEIFTVEKRDDDVGKIIYDATFEFGQSSHMTAIKALFEYPCSHNFEKFGSANVSEIENWDILHLSPSKMEKLINTSEHKYLKCMEDEKLKIVRTDPTNDDDISGIHKMYTGLAIYQKVPITELWVDNDILKEHYSNPYILTCTRTKDALMSVLTKIEQILGFLVTF